ncbi:MAG: MBL fold metallo-hydrolase [Tabrizicola sp.]|jgi:hydroxyacylglutathione hydrolase|nr:MBL fold metallo-hydrolase [Tabrizicola sp.]
MTTLQTIAPGLGLLRADNPSPLTGTGTNTYVLGTDELTVIDPGPDLDAHLVAILSAAADRPIRQILVTHAHRDHSGLAPRLSARTGAEVMAFGTAQDGVSPRMARLPGLAAEGEGLDTAFVPDRRLVDGDRVSGPGFMLEVLHTPGHLGGHLCFALDGTLFTGDHVMGWASTIVSPPEGDMTDYIASLHRLAARPWTLGFPGHGPPIPDPVGRISDLIFHRRQREAEILHALGDGPATPAALTARIYHQTPRPLWPAAQRNVLAHLVDLEGRNLVQADPILSPDARFHRV